ncbi:MAG: hypothetical protein AABX30_00410 [Nanoarchaeota archaeon]
MTYDVAALTANYYLAGAFAVQGQIETRGIEKIKKQISVEPVAQPPPARRLKDDALGNINDGLGGIVDLLV